ncbi:uncharacterized protein EV420DRAFT_1673014 [Desarmillaria tabescens]|uniref:Uncharacterized protein n=1 Tax=Armillaria tabescens TaxID=1929756 RepID=A0AA39KHR8_ARMTA|nr:uncharacterized protein EV420DRAFT_1673014 [Desarmillaria tabescens]KAK0460074.1 hypothetical protein EV420DRAFT_1673014 [Desarmillaria tabescens]
MDSARETRDLPQHNGWQRVVLLAALQDMRTANEAELSLPKMKVSRDSLSDKGFCDEEGDAQGFTERWRRSGSKDKSGTRPWWQMIFRKSARKLSSRDALRSVGQTKTRRALLDARYTGTIKKKHTAKIGLIKDSRIPAEFISIEKYADQVRRITVVQVVEPVSKIREKTKLYTIGGLRQPRRRTRGLNEEISNPDSDSPPFVPRVT